MIWRDQNIYLALVHALQTSSADEIRAWICNNISQFYVDVISYPRPKLRGGSANIVVEEVAN